MEGRQMTRCDRFEEEALLRLEQGLSPDELDEHFATCPDCREARAFYDRLRQDVAGAGVGEEPPPGWQAQVRQRIGHRRTWRRRWAWGFGSTLAAAAVAFLIVALPRPETSPALRFEIVAGAMARRGEEAHPGDRLALTAHLGAARFAELRVYRDDRELVFRCLGSPLCVRDDGTLQASFELPSRGTYQALLLLSPEPLPPPTSGLDSDTSAALDAGAEVLMARQVTVR